MLTSLVCLLIKEIKTERDIARWKIKNTIKKGICKDSFSKSKTTKRAKTAIEKAAPPYILAIVINAPLAFLYDGIICGLINIIEPTNNSNSPLIKIKIFMILNFVNNKYTNSYGHLKYNRRRIR